MTDEEILANSKVLEEDFVKKASIGGLHIDGVIVFGHRDDNFDFLPMEGYDNCPTFSEMCQTKVDKSVLTTEERSTPFHLKTPEDPVGSDAKLFLRVEEGNKKQSLSLSASKSLS